MSFHIILWQEGKYWVAKCLENAVASQGFSQTEARENLQEALALSLEDERVDLPQIQNVSSEELSLA